MKSMLKRNILLYYRDKANVFFSLLSSIMIITLFALFLGQGDWGGDRIRDSWLMSGVLAVTTLTTALGAFSVMVEDKVGKIVKGFYASPIKRGSIAAAYILSPFFVSLIMTIIITIAFGAYIIATGGDMPGLIGMSQLIGLILLSGITATSMICFVISFINTNSVYGTVTAIIGILSGFLMGIYIPIGLLPNLVQKLIMLFPPAHIAMLFRQILVDKPLEIATMGAPDFVVTQLKEELGIVFKLGDFEITPLMSIAYLSVTTIIFFSLSVFKIRKTR